jgi:hypothetical protein
MALWKMAKGAGESIRQNIDVLLDASSRVVYIVKTWMQVFDILQYKLINCLEELSYEVIKT